MKKVDETNWQDSMDAYKAHYKDRFYLYGESVVSYSEVRFYGKELRHLISNKNCYNGERLPEYKSKTLALKCLVYELFPKATIYKDGRIRLNE